MTAALSPPTPAQGRCPGELCWYTLPLDDDGLVVPHSKSGVIEVCEGGGRPPRPSLKQEQADRLAAAREAVAQFVFNSVMVERGAPWSWPTNLPSGVCEQWLESADRLLSLPEVQALIEGRTS